MTTPVVSPPDLTLTTVPSVETLNGYVGKHIKEICGNAYHSDEANHCAHFIGHIMGFHFGSKCKDFTGHGPEPGATLKMHELFSKCPEVGEWEARTQNACLVFVTARGNVRLEEHEMDNVRRIHVGIFHSGMIWHYANAKHRVAVQGPSAFSRHYPGSQIALFYGTFPL